MGLGPKQEGGLGVADVIAELKRHVAPIGDVGHASNQQATSGLPFIGIATADPKVDGNHAVEFKAQRQLQRLMGGGVGRPEHGTDDGEQRPVNATHGAEGSQFRNRLEGDGSEQVLEYGLKQARRKAFEGFLTGTVRHGLQPPCRRQQAPVELGVNQPFQALGAADKVVNQQPKQASYVYFSLGCFGSC